MRICIFAIKWPPETFIRRKLEWLASAGHAVTVFAGSWERDSSNTTIRVVRLPESYRRMGRVWMVAGLLFKHMLTRPGQLIRLWRTTRGENNSLNLFAALLTTLGYTPDILHFEWNGSAINYQILFDWWGNTRTVISCRGSQVQIAPYVPIDHVRPEDLRATFEKADGVHCVSTAIMHEAEHFGLDPRKAWVIRPSVDPTVFRPDPYQPGAPFRLISIGSLTWRKGYDYALLAVRRLVDAGTAVHFEIIGSGQDAQRVIFGVHDLDLQDYVTISGQLPPAQVVRRLQAADVFVLSSLSEGISNAVLEAMACRLPVVTTDCGGMREAVTDGVEGFVVPVRDPEAMADKLMILAYDADLRRCMGEKGRARILRDFTLEQQRDLFIAMYEALTASCCMKQGAQCG